MVTFFPRVRYFIFLEELDLSNLKNIKYINNNFLFGCNIIKKNNMQ